jgi:TatD DNase family protein
MPTDPAPQWTDAHCHLDDPRQPGGLDAVLAAARAAGVTTMISVGCDAASSQRAIAIAVAHDGVWATVGLHPHEARFGVESIVPVLDDPASADVVVAVGEAGLDYFYDHSPREAQRTAFAAQVQLAHERRLPLVIHTRDAWADTFDVLAAEGVPERTIFHCFTGGVAEADRCLEMGAFLSFSGIVTFKGATDVHEAARRCPLDRLLVETDSPYLAPVPHRGRPNQPAYVPAVGAAIAALHGVTTERVGEQTRANAAVAFPRLRP